MYNNSSGDFLLHYNHQKNMIKLSKDEMRFRITRYSIKMKLSKIVIIKLNMFENYRSKSIIHTHTDTPI